MATAKISQREARRLKKLVAEFHATQEKQRRYWVTDYPGGTHIGTATPDASCLWSAYTARKLGHAVVCVVAGNELSLYALPLPKDK